MHQDQANFSPPNSPRSQSGRRWLKDSSLYASPVQTPNTAAARLQPLEEKQDSDTEPAITQIEIVPPSPRRSSRPIPVPAEPDVIPPLPTTTIPMEAPWLGRAEFEPRTLPASYEDDMLATPRSGRLSATNTPRHRARLMMNRMSRSIHAGTPPPAVMRMLHPDDAMARPSHLRSPISHTFLKDGRRSSIASNNVGSRRQSMVSVSGQRDSRFLDPTDVDAALNAEEDREEEEEEEEGEVEVEGVDEEERYRNRKRRSARRPPFVSQTSNSDETYFSGSTPGRRARRITDTSSTTASSNVSMSRVDPLTVLERRRRRDYTLGSHHPLHGPPNTPATSSGSVSRGSDEEEVQSVHLSDLVDRFRTLFQRIGDMPWVAKPCVATLVIPNPNLNLRSTDGAAPAVTGWYRPKPSLDQLLEEGMMDTADDGSATLAHHSGFGASANHAKLGGGGSGGYPKWIPRKPEPMHQQMGRDRFGEALVVRGVVGVPRSRSVSGEGSQSFE